MEDFAIAVVFAVTGWMLRTWLTHRERMKELSMAKLGLGASEQRLARVEHAVEAIAIEVERIGEGQRYVTTLLDERAQPALVAPAGAARRPRRGPGRGARAGSTARSRSGRRSAPGAAGRPRRCAA